MSKFSVAVHFYSTVISFIETTGLLMVPFVGFVVLMNHGVTIAATVTIFLFFFWLIGLVTLISTERYYLDIMADKNLARRQKSA